jgi:hypothetical protein
MIGAVTARTAFGKLQAILHCHVCMNALSIDVLASRGVTRSGDGDDDLAPMRDAGFVQRLARNSPKDEFKISLMPYADGKSLHI